MSDPINYNVVMPHENDAGKFRVSAIGSVLDITNTDAADLLVSAKSDSAGQLRVSSFSNDGALHRISAIQDGAAALNVSAKSNDGALLRVSAVQDGGGNLRVSAIQDGAGALNVSAKSNDGGTFRVSAMGIRGNTYAAITTSAQTTVKSAAGFLHGVLFNSQNISAVRLYDNTVSGSPTILTFPASAQTGGPFYELDLEFATGLTVSSGSSNTDITVIYV